MTAANQNFISLAKFDPNTSKYEFFNLQKVKPAAILGTSKWWTITRFGPMYLLVRIATSLELTELNNDRFTYTRMGKDNAGNDIQVFVEHEPYQGTYHPAFTF